MEEAGTPASWFYERLSYDERREVRDPDETLENYCLMLNQYVSELRRRPPDRDDPSTQGFFRWMAGQIHDMVRVSAQSSSICLYENGPAAISGRIYKNGMMYGKVPIDMHDVFFFDDVAHSFVPISFQEDLMSGFADSNQLFYIDAQRDVAISANQTLVGLMNGGSIEPYPRFQADQERWRQPGERRPAPDA